MQTGLKETLEALAALVMAHSKYAGVMVLARELLEEAGQPTDRLAIAGAIEAGLRRRYIYAPNPTMSEATRSPYVILNSDATALDNTEFAVLFASTYCVVQPRETCALALRDHGQCFYTHILNAVRDGEKWVPFDVANEHGASAPYTHQAIALITTGLIIEETEGSKSP